MKKNKKNNKKEEPSFLFILDFPCQSFYTCRYIFEFGKFSFNDKCFWCRIVKVYDGDSVTGIIQFEKTFYKTERNRRM